LLVGDAIVFRVEVELAEDGLVEFSPSCVGGVAVQGLRVDENFDTCPQEGRTGVEPRLIGRKFGLDSGALVGDGLEAVSDLPAAAPPSTRSRRFSSLASRVVSIFGNGYEGYGRSRLRSPRWRPGARAALAAGHRGAGVA
jgi:hypothetical protein